MSLPVLVYKPEEKSWPAIEKRLLQPGRQSRSGCCCLRSTVYPYSLPGLVYKLEVRSGPVTEHQLLQLPPNGIPVYSLRCPVPVIEKQLR